MRTRGGVYNGDDSSSGLSSPPSLLELTDDDDSADNRPIVSGFFQSLPPRETDPWKKKPKEVVEAVKREPTPSLGGIVPALVGKRGKRTAVQRKPKDKKPDVKVEAPEHWEEMYNAVLEMRSRVPAPVDTMGCERLADDATTPKLRRFQTLISLMLSSQTKDTVNAVAMKDLQTKLPGGLCLESILEVEPKRLDELIRVVGFHNRKTEYIKKAAVIMRDKHGGDIPDTFAGLTALPGVGPKMAHLCLSAAWDRTEGIGVDVHVHRITNLWGWVDTTTPEGTREALESWLPRDKWREINFMLVGFGQTICLPRGRKCGECTLSNGLCRAAFVTPKKVKKEKRVISEDEDDDGDIPYAESPVKRKRKRKVKAEIKEEEDSDGIIADIEDAIPSIVKYKSR